MTAAGSRASRRPPGSPPSVLHLIETLGSGGAERLLFTNLKHLPEGMRHTVVTVFAGEEGYWAEPIRRLGVRVESLGCAGYRDLRRGLWRLRALLRREKIDLAHTHLWAANVIGAAAGRLAGVPVIASIHNVDYEPAARADGSSLGPRKREVIRALESWSLRFGADRLIAVSEYVKGSARRYLHYPAGRIDVLHNAVDVDELCRAPRMDRAEVRRSLSLPADCALLLSVGRISPAKGLIHAIRALALVAKSHPGVHLLAVGATDDRAWLAHSEQTARAAGVADRVHFAGARDDVPDLLRACDLFVFPSLHEGLGIALAEALVAGRASVASRVGPIPEVITHGENGWLVPPGDERALAEGVVTLLGDANLRGALGERAAARARAQFEPREAARKLAGIYQTVLRKKR